MELIIREARGWRRKHCGEKSGRCQKRVPALKMVRRLFLLAILPIVASLEALRGREEGGRDLTCRWFRRRVKATVVVQTRTKNKRGRVKLAMFRGGGLGSYTALPFCLPMLYSRLLPPHGIWVSMLAAQKQKPQPDSVTSWTWMLLAFKQLHIHFRAFKPSYIFEKPKQPQNWETY